MILEQLEILIRKIISENSFPVLAKVDRVDTKNYICDCIELSNTGGETNTIYTRVAIPKLWGTEQGGIWMAPSKGSVVLLNFLNGDRNYPVIAAVMGSAQKETAPEDTFIVKLGNTELRLDDNITISSGTTEISLNNNNRTIGIKNGTASLSRLLKDMIRDISLVKTVDGKPLSPDDIIKLQAFAGKISGLLEE